VDLLISFRVHSQKSKTFFISLPEPILNMADETEKPVTSDFFEEKKNSQVFHIRLICTLEIFWSTLFFFHQETPQ